MPLVPTYDVPRQQLQPGLNFRDNTHATGDMFGAGIGEALGSVGKGLTDIGQAVQEVRRMEKQANVLSGVQQAMQEKDRLLLGDGTTPGYSSMQGKAAVDGFAPFQQEWEKAKAKIRDSLDPDAQREFDQRIMAVDTDALRQGLTVRATGQKNFIVSEHVSASDNFKTQAIQSPLDEQRFNGYIASGLGEIEQLAPKLGWGQQRIDREKATYVSDARKQAAFSISLSDPIAALKYTTDHSSEFLPEDMMTALDKIRSGAIGAVKRDASHTTQANPRPDQFAATGLPTGAYALLGTIGHTEAPAYDVVNGGARFRDFSQHPGIVGPGGSSTAAGRYQFTKGTWGRVSNALGLTDFSPVSQDVGALWLAQSDYRTRTGRSLGSDINAGNWSQIRSGLAPTWEGLAKLSDAEFGKMMEARMNGIVTIGSGGQPGNEQQPAAGQAPAPTIQPNTSARPDAGTIKFSPEVESVLAGLPPAYADQLRQSAVSVSAQDQVAQRQLEKAGREAQADRYRLRIANADDSLTTTDINEDPMLDDGQKASLINTLNEKNKEVVQTRQSVEAFAAGKLAIDSYSEEGRKTNDAVWKQLVTMAAPEQRQPLLDALVKQTGIVPTDVINKARFNLSSGNPQQAQAALDMGSHLRSVDPAALARSPSGGALADQVALYDHYTSSVGLAPAEATRRILDAQDPDKVRQRAALMNTEPMKKAIDAAATESNVRSLFGGGWLSSSPTLGKNAAQSAAIVSDYRDTLVESVFDAGGDVDAGTKLANDRFQRRYGTSSLSMDGPSSVMFLPPEKTYPSDPKGSHDYIREQALAAVSLAEKAKGVPDRMVVGNPAGLVEKGNIDLLARPQVKNEDGSISTVRSMSFDEDGKEVLIPTVSPDGKILSNQDAIDLYRRTGQHLGKFSSVDAADAYAEALHNQQADFYSSSSQVKNVFLVLDKITEADVRAGRAPRYQAWYTDSKGKYQFAPARFFATPPAGSGKPATDPSLIPSLEAIRQDSLKWNADMSPADMAPDQMITGPMPKIELSAPSPDQSLSQDISPADMAPGPLTVPAEKPAKARK